MNKIYPQLVNTAKVLLPQKVYRALRRYKNPHVLIYRKLDRTAKVLLPPKAYRELKRYEYYLTNGKYYGDGVYNIRSRELQPPSKPKQIKSQNKKRYGVIWAPSRSNYGDDIQALAAIHLLKKFGVEEVVFIDREKAFLYKGEPVHVVMNGWYMSNYRYFPPTKQIHPFFISFHVTPEEVIRDNIDYFKTHGPIGCRDLSTLQKCQKYGIDAYFSGCLTLTFDEVWPKSEQTYLVDVVPPFNRDTRLELDLSKITASEQGQFITQGAPPIPKKENLTRHLKYVECLLDKYKKAKLVITSRLHCALPCQAFGTDVVFVHNNYAKDPRFKGLEKYLNGYDGGEPGSQPDLSYQSVNRALINQRKQRIYDLFSRWMEKTKPAVNTNP